MAKNGSKFKIYLVTGSDVNTLLGGNLSASITINQTIIDVSDKDSDWMEKLGGQKDWSASGSFNIDELSTSTQVDVFESLVAGTEVRVFIGEVSTNRVYGYLGNALIESIAISGDKDAAVTKDISFQGTGELTNVTETPATTTTTTTAG